MNPTPVTYGDTAALDAFSRLRTSEPFGVNDNKNISDRNRNQWEEIINGGIITYTGLTGTFQADEEIRGTLPTGYIAIATINTDNGTNSMNVNMDHNDFVVGDTITGQTSGATAEVVSIGTGSDIQHDYDRSSIILTTGTAATDKAIRSTHRYHAYVPGKSNLVKMTFIMGAATSNVTRRVGFFDDLNGLFLEQTGTDVAFVIRSSTSGATVDTRYTQDAWNINRFQGASCGKEVLDLTKAQILIIDFQWLGVGRIRFGFNVGGKVVYAHEVRNANNTNVVYMKTPSLPTRYEISNTGATSGQTTLEEICSSVSSEGGYALPGMEFSVSNEVTAKSITANTPIIAIRLKTAYPAGKQNRRTAKFLTASFMVQTNDAHIEIQHVHEPIDITATWTDVGGGSALEYSTDISAFTGRPTHDILEEYAPTAQAGKAAAVSVSGAVVNQHGFISQNYDSTNSQMFVLSAEPFTGTSLISAALTWIEFE